MLSLRDCQVLFDQKFRELDLPEIPANLYEPIRYMLGLEAKRLRPSLVIMACNVFSDNIEPAIYPAMAIEVFHNFTLMHDDIMDQSVLRRNQPTVQARWNPNIAILSGDAMVIKAYMLLSQTPGKYLPMVMRVFNQTALQVCEGQQYDMDYERSLSVSRDDYIRMVQYKTAVLLAASLKIGAIAGAAEESEADCLYEFGKNIGIAFQLQDDLLDVFAEPSVFGKVTGNDIVSNKKTILLIEALNQTTGSKRELLLDWLAKKDFDRQEKIRAITSVYQELNLEINILDQVRHYHDLALANLAGLKVDASRKSELRSFTEYLMNRKK